MDPDPHTINADPHHYWARVLLMQIRNTEYQDNDDDILGLHHLRVMTALESLHLAHLPGVKDPEAALRHVFSINVFMLSVHDIFFMQFNNQNINCSMTKIVNNFKAGFALYH